MKRQAGLWIDHREAFIVFLGDDGDETRRIDSGMEKHVRFSGGNRPEDGSADDQRDRQFTAHLNRYYDEVISYIRDVESILLFGPGEAKGELEKRVATKGLGGRIVGIETTDTMTDRQIAAKVREHFQKYTCQFNDPYESTSFSLLVRLYKRDTPATWNGQGRN